MTALFRRRLLNANNTEMLEMQKLSLLASAVLENETADSTPFLFPQAVDTCVYLLRHSDSQQPRWHLLSSYGALEVIYKKSQPLLIFKEAH